jgi:hypothetical protein
MKKILDEYYQSMNNHTLDCLEFLSDDVVVTFLEKERNWNGKEMAKEKFGKMFSLYPTMNGEILEIFKETEDSLSVFVYFGDKDESLNTKFEKKKIMIYTFDSNKIKRIDHC